MGNGSIKVDGLSISPRFGAGLITNGKLLKFDSPYPLDEFRLIGGEIALDFGRLTVSEEAGHSTPVGQLALIFLRGSAEDHLDESDLPLPEDGLGGLLRFAISRKATSYLSLLEYRWPLMAPALRQGRWSWVQPQFTLGVGAHTIHTQVEEDGSQPEIITNFDLLLTGATHVRLVSLELDPVHLSIELGVRLFAGQAFGFLGEGLFRSSYRF
jgi:hypothetical protein